MIPNLPNKPGTLCEVLAYTGKPNHGTRREYICRSYLPRVDRNRYSSKVRAKLEEGVIWEITQTSPPPKQIDTTEWQLILQHKMTLATPKGKSENAWPFLARAIRQHFPTPNRVHFALHVYSS